MGKVGTRLPNFCLNRIRPHVRVRSPPIESKRDADSAAKNSGDEKNVGGGSNGEEKISANNNNNGEVKQVVNNGRKIMIVVDSSFEAKGALLWALSHTVQSHDLVILLCVTKPSKQVASPEESSRETSPRAYELVNSLKSMSQLKRPEIKIETAVVGGKEKGPLIVEEARKQGVGLLVLGQKKRSVTWRLLMMWATNRVTGTTSVVEYCIQNADCMAIAVRRKSKRHGGYLITTKRHKDFWLLA